VRFLRGPAVGGGARQFRAFQIDVPHRLFVQPVVVLGDHRGREGVGLGDVGAGGEILVVQAGDDVGPGQAQDVVIALHLADVAGEALAAEILFRQVAALDHHAPGPVEHEDALFGGPVQGGDAFAAGQGGTHTAAFVSRTPSTRQIA